MQMKTASAISTSRSISGVEISKSSRIEA